MGRVDKIFCWVINGQKSQLEWYMQKRKGKVDLSEQRLDEKGRTALHLACRHQQYDIVRYLLRQHVNCLVQDTKGNVPLLLAARAKKKEKQVYYDIALALLEACADALYVTNHRGQCADQWFKHFGLNDVKEQPTTTRRGDEQYSDSYPKRTAADDLFNDEWADKLREECEFEYFQHWGNYEQDFSDDFTSTTKESYDAWAERITSEFRARKRYGGIHYSSPKPKAKRAKWSAEDQANFERMARQEEERRLNNKKAKAAVKLRRKKQKYELLCQELFTAGNSSKISLSQLPEATDAFVSTLLSDIQDKRYGGIHYSSPKPKAKKAKWSAEDQANFERMARQEEERRLNNKKAKAAVKLRRKKQKYELLCQELFTAGNSSKISLSQLPEATDAFVSTLLSDIQDDQKLIKSFLREQQIKWHPDKLMQKRDQQRLSSHERESILDRVKQLSQILNGYLKTMYD